MLVTMTVSLLLAATPAPGPQATRTLRLSVADASGRAIHDLQVQEVVVLENGVVRPVLRLSKDTRPLTLALVVDTSVGMATEFRLNVVPALTSFLVKLAEGTRVALWTTGARPSRVAEWTSDRRSIEHVLTRVIPEGGNVLIDSVDEALDALKLAEGRRMALVVVSGNDVEFSSRDEALALERSELRTGIEVDAVLIDVAERAPSALGRELDEPLGTQQVRYERTLGGLSSKTGGIYEHLLSAMSLEAALASIAIDLAEDYLLTYVAAPGARAAKTKVLVSRPNAHTRFVPQVQ